MGMMEEGMFLFLDRGYRGVRAIVFLSYFFQTMFAIASSKGRGVPRTLDSAWHCSLLSIRVVTLLGRV